MKDGFLKGFDCSGLKVIVIPEGVKYLTGKSFLLDKDRMSSVEVIFLPSSLEYISPDVIKFQESGFVNLKEIKVSKGNKIFSTIDGILFNVVKGSLVWFPRKAFKDKIYKVPNRVKNIGNSAFCSCECEVIILSDSVESVEGYAFCKSSTKEIYLSNNVKSIGEGIFCKSSIVNVELPKHITEIPDMTFYYCKYLKSVSIPEDVKKIGRYAFYSCEGLYTVKLPFMLECIGDNAFFDCKYLRVIEIPSNVRKIGEYAFGGCYYLWKVIIREGLEELGGSIFKSCNNLEEVHLPESIKNIDMNCFSRDVTLYLHKGSYVLDNYELIFKDNRPNKRVVEEDKTTILNIFSGLLNKGLSSGEVYTTLSSKGFSESDIMELLYLNDSNSKLVKDYCDSKILPNVVKLLKTEGLTVGDVSNLLYANYSKMLVDSVIVEFLKENYLID